MSVAAAIRRLDRSELQRCLPLLDAWLLPGSFYGVQHTWPMLYRSDGSGSFFGVFDDDRLLAHCAFRVAPLRTGAGLRRVALLGSVATDPAHRGRGLASSLLQTALEECRSQGVDAVLLWAEQPDLYARCGFEPGPAESCALLRAGAPGAAAPARAGVRIRLAEVGDHEDLLRLHGQKPQGVVRDRQTMSGLLTTPGMWTFVLQRGETVLAYACCGKGADLQNWWHEVGGEDAAVAALLPAAIRELGAPEAFVMLPPYRPALPQLLRAHTVEQAGIAGPMVHRIAPGPLPSFYIDGLDSV